MLNRAERNEKKFPAANTCMPPEGLLHLQNKIQIDGCVGEGPPILQCPDKHGAAPIVRVLTDSPEPQGNVS